MRTANRFKMSIPLIIYVIYLLYLAFINTDQFLTKWIDGSFAFFIALVFSNIIRNGIVREHEGEQKED
jgi:hypothetical protein